MKYTDSQKIELMAMRRGTAGSGGVLLVGGFLLVWFTVPSTLPWWFGWVVIGAGALALLFSAAVCLFPAFLCRPETDEKNTRRAA
jgi:uncharacterized BrkB/YihY/UPF0761 family membrane protein